MNVFEFHIEYNETILMFFYKDYKKNYTTLMHQKC